MLRRTFLLCLAVVATALTSGARADSRIRSVTGVITEINTSTDPDRITVALANQTWVTFGVTNNTEIEVNGDENADISDLAVGDTVKVKLDARTGAALSIKVEEDEDQHETDARGTLLGSSGGQATIDTTGDGLPDLTLDVSQNTRVKIGSFKLTVDELDELSGLPVKLTYVPGDVAGTGTLLEIQADTQQAEWLQGTVTAVDLNQQTLTLATDNGAVTLYVPDDLRITRAGRPVGLQALAAGDQVRVQALLNEAGTEGVALRIELRAPVLKKVNGRITNVAGNTLTVVVGRTTQTFVVDANTRFTFNNRAGTLATLQTALDQNRKVQAQITYREQTGDDLAVEVKANISGGRLR